jgi:hypothetical protein
MFGGLFFVFAPEKKLSESTRICKGLILKSNCLKIEHKKAYAHIRIRISKPLNSILTKTFISPGAKTIIDLAIAGSWFLTKTTEQNGLLGRPQSH